MTHVTLFIYTIVFLITKGFINGSWRLRMVGLGYAPWPKNEIKSQMYCRKNLEQQKQERSNTKDQLWPMSADRSWDNRSLRTPSLWVNQKWFMRNILINKYLRVRTQMLSALKKSWGSFLDECRISVIWTPILDRTQHETENS